MFEAPGPVGALRQAASPVRLGGATATLEVDGREIAWLKVSNRPTRHRLGESVLTCFRVEPGLWVMGGTYPDLPAGVRLSSLDGAGAAVELARGAAGWVALIRAAGHTRLNAVWSLETDRPWDRKVLPPLTDLVSHDYGVTYYGPRRPGR